MVYLLKFVAGFLLPPGIFFVLFFVIAFILWRMNQKKLASSLGVVTFLFYLLSTGLVAGLLIGSLEDKYDIPNELQGDCIVLLGGGATQDTPAVTGTGNICGAPASRLLTAFQVYQKVHVPIVVSGGQVYADSGSEALLAKRELMELGVPEQDIIVEAASLNTRQNAVFSYRLMSERGLCRPLLVTSAFHMERAMVNFIKEGLEPVAVPADFHRSRNRSWHPNWLTPSSGAMDDSVIFIREKVRTAVTKYLE